MPRALMKVDSDEPPLSSTEKSASTSIDVRPTYIRSWLLYMADWAVAIAVTAVSQIILIPKPFSMTFIVTNPDIQQRYYDDQFDLTRVCVVLSTAIPTVIIVLWLGYFRRSVSDIHQALLGLGMALSFCALFTGIFKQTNIIPSSDFLDRCKLNQADFERSYRTGVALSYRDCNGKDVNRAVRYYPSFTMSISSCSMAYLSLFASIQLGLWLHPQVRRQLREIAPGRPANHNRPGQTLISLICLLPIAAGMSFIALEAKYHGPGNGWGTTSGIIIGFVAALWAHILYCSDMPGAMIPRIYL
ncbi:hypothetical protein H4R24_001786 [Coemansia sp. RSA 988]|nr:hypothetical protein H4R24_001786 [Coemansia sp. RSA 988]